MKKEERRLAMPESTAFLDDMRNAFGAEAIVGLWASENGHEIEWGEKMESGREYIAHPAPKLP